MSKKYEYDMFGIYPGQKLQFFGGTGISRLVRFFGPQGTALLQKPHYLGTDLVLK